MDENSIRDHRKELQNKKKTKLYRFLFNENYDRDHLRRLRVECLQSKSSA